MPTTVAVTSADFIRNIDYWQNEALRRPVSITHHGRERLVLAAPEAFRAAQADTGVGALAVADALRTQLSTLSDAMEEGYLAFDQQHRVQESNPTAQAFLGRPAAEMVGLAALDLFPQPIASILNDRLQTVRRARKMERFDAGAFDGRTLSVKVLPTADGAIVLFQNTTEHKVLRQRFEEQEALRRAGLDHPLIVALRLDSRARIEWIDEKFGAFTGFNASDLAGHRFVDLLAASKRRGVAELIERVLTERSVSQADVTFLGRNGGEYSGHLTLAPVLSDYIAHGVAGMFVGPDGAASGEQSRSAGRASA